MKKKTVFSTEFAYAVGIVTLAFGTALMEKADFGMSMVVAPAYLVFLKLSQVWEWFTFGMAEYCLQAVLLVITAAALRRFRPMYLFSFCTAVIYGFVLDGCISLTVGVPSASMISRCVLFVLGLLACSVGVAMLFHTYIAPEAYELLVKEISAKFGKEISVVKTIYDCTSCTVAIVLSFLFFGFGHFEGVKWGTILCALINGWIIGKISKWLEMTFDFRDTWQGRGE